MLLFWYFLYNLNVFVYWIRLGIDWSFLLLVSVLILVLIFFFFIWMWFVKFVIKSNFIRCGGLNKKIREIMVVKLGCVLNFI